PASHSWSTASTASFAASERRFGLSDSRSTECEWWSALWNSRLADIAARTGPVDSRSPDDDARAGDRARRSDHPDWRTASCLSRLDEPDSSLARTSERAPREAAWLGHVNEPTGEWNGRS